MPEERRFVIMKKINIFSIKVLLPLFLLVMTLLLSFYTKTSASDFNAFTVYGFRFAGGSLQTYESGGVTYFIIDEGGLRDKDPGDGDDCNTYNEGENCGNSSHKPGSQSYPEHLHVSRSDWPTQNWSNYPAISQYESDEFWDVLISNGGVDYLNRHHPWGTGFTDNGVTWIMSYFGGVNSDFHYNCHGYAFDKDGLSNFQLLLGDYGDGAQNILDAYYSEFVPETESMQSTIMFMGGHSNYIETETANCRAKVINFKYRSSQSFSFIYDDSGRDSDQEFFGSEPEYWKKN
jgi:hypothetical protein